MGASIEGVHRSYDLCNMLPLDSPREAEAPSIKDLEEGTVDGECKRTLEKIASTGPRHQNRSEFLQNGRKMASTKTQMIQSKWSQAVSR